VLWRKEELHERSINTGSGFSAAMTDLDKLPDPSESRCLSGRLSHELVIEFEC
jgi:hypothetical protein